MTPGAHLLASWAIAAHDRLSARERRLVTLAGVLPDIDGLGVVADLLTGGRTAFYDTFHHALAHNLLAGLLLAVVAGLLAGTRKVLVAALALATFHLHLLLDLAGSRGPDGYQWPIPYLLPFTRSLQLSWQGQWSFNGWQNQTILAVLLLWAILHAARHRRSFIEVISARLDGAIFRAVAQRWPA